MSTTPLNRIQALPLYAIERVDKPGQDREYITPEGVLNSVTSILSGTRDNSGIDNWRESVGATRADLIRDLACWRGNRHDENITEYLLTGKEPEFNFFYSPYWTSTRTFVRSINQTLLTQAPIWHPDGFAGTADWLGYLSATDDSATLIDWKTADRDLKPYKLYEYSLQLAAYRAALHHVYKPQGLRIRQAVIAAAYPNRTPLIETFTEDALDQLFLHFQGRLQRYIYAKRT